MKKTMLLLALSLWVWSAQAQSITDFYTQIAEKNPQVRAAYQGYLGKLKTIDQVGPIDPELTAGYFITPMMMPDGEQRAMLSLMQMFPWFGTLKTERDMRAKEADVAYLLFLHEVNRVFYEMRNMLIEQKERERQISLYQDLLTILQDEEQLARAAVASGEGGLERIIDLQDEADDLRTRLSILENNTERFQQTLPLWVEAEALTSWDDFALPSLAWEELLRPDFAQNPLWLALDSRQEALAQQEVLADKMGKPMFGLGMAYTLVGPLQQMMEPSNPRNLVQPMLNLSLPLYRKKYNAGTAMAQIGQQQVLEERKEQMNGWQMRLRALQSDFKSSTEREQWIDRQLARNQDRLALAQADQKAGGEGLDRILMLKRQEKNLHFQQEEEKFKQAYIANEFQFLVGQAFRSAVNIEKE